MRSPRSCSHTATSHYPLYAGVAENPRRPVIPSADRRLAGRPCHSRSFISTGDEDSGGAGAETVASSGPIFGSPLVASDEAPGFLLRFAFAGFDETGPCRRRRSSAVEQLIRNQQVLGSSPSAGSILSITCGSNRSSPIGSG